MSEKTIFIDESRGVQKEILVGFKSELSITWTEMSEILGISRKMIFNYINDDCKLPFKHVDTLCNISHKDNSEFCKLKTIETLKFTQNSIKEPKFNEKLAEFLGALAGDGCVCKTGYRIEITCSALVDKNYIEKIVIRFFRDLFNLNAKGDRQKNAMFVRVYSKELFDFLSQKCEFPIGKKKNKLFIQKRILKNKKFLRAYLRGLFDTDGSFHRHHKNTAAVEYISHSPNFLAQMKQALIELGFRATSSKTSVYIYDKKHIDKFFKEIKPNNLKHLYKYNQFKRTGQVPLHKDMLMQPWSSG